MRKRKRLDSWRVGHMLLYSSFADSEAPLWFFAGCWVTFHVHRAQNQRHREKRCLLWFVKLPLTHALKQYAHCKHTHCECMWAHMPQRHYVKPPHLPTTMLRGIKQTVIDLWYDCLFCRAVSDGWRFVRIWKVCVKYGWEWGEEGCLKSTSPRRNTSGPQGRPVIKPSPRLQLNAPHSAVVTRQSPF